MSDFFDYYNKVQEAIQENQEKAQELAEKGQTELAGEQAKAQMKDILGGVLELKATMLGQKVFEKIPFKKVSEKLSENLKSHLEDAKNNFLDNIKKPQEMEGIELDDLNPLEETGNIIENLTQQSQNVAENITGRAQELAQNLTQRVQETAENITQAVRQARIPLSSEHMDEINEQVSRETAEFRQDLVPQFEQDEFDIQAQRIYNGARGIMDKMEGMDPESSGYRVLNKVLSKSKKDMEDLMDAKEEAMGTRQLNINKSPTEEQYRQIEEFNAQRRNELIEQKQAELNPEPAEQVEQTVQTGTEAVEGAVQEGAEVAGQVAEKAGEVSEKVANIGSKVSEGVEAGLETAETALDAFGIGEVLQLLTAVGFGIGGEQLMKHKKEFQDKAKQKIQALNPAQNLGITEQ